MEQYENTEIKINIPKKLYELIKVMASISKKELSMELTAEDLISKQVVQYFGTRNSLDLMTYSSKRFSDALNDDFEQIEKLNEEFNKTIIELDRIATETNKLFYKVINKLEDISK